MEFQHFQFIYLLFAFYTICNVIIFDSYSNMKIYYLFAVYFKYTQIILESLMLFKKLILNKYPSVPKRLQISSLVYVLFIPSLSPHFQKLRITLHY